MLSFLALSASAPVAGWEEIPGRQGFVRPGQKDSLNVSSITFARWMAAFTYDLCAAFGPFAVRTAEVLAFLGYAATGGILTLLWL